MVASEVSGHNFFRRLICPRTTVARTYSYPITGAATSSPPCAKPQTLVKGKPGVRTELDARFEAGRKHPPVVTLRPVA
jgi:hypothetical protein